MKEKYCDLLSYYTGELKVNHTEFSVYSIKYIHTL